MKNIYTEIANRVLVLDGAMGSLIQQYKLTEKDFRGEKFANHKINLIGCNDLLCITQPWVIENIHNEYLEAGADIIETNTFNATNISLADYKLEKFAYKINLEAAKIAKKMADKFTRQNPKKPRFVAGSIGPTAKAASFSSDVMNPAFRSAYFDDFKKAYTEQVKGLLDGGVDIFLVETIFDTLNAKAALYAIEEVCSEHGQKIPVMVSGTIADKSGRTLSGQTVEAFLNSLSHIELLSIGFNCSFGAKDMLPHIETLAKKAPFNISAYPNAGLPNQFGQYDETPETMAENIKIILDNQFVNIIGGCCGTTPEHIKKIVEIAENAKKHILPQIQKETKLSGLEPLTIYKDSNLILVSERANVAGSKKFAKLIQEKKYDEALSILRQQIEAGANMLDINMDDSMLDSEKEMITFLNLIASEPEIAKVPLMIDSSKWNVIEAGLKCIQGKPIVNSISLKDGEQIFLNYAQKIINYGAATIVMLFDENGQATTFERKIEIAARAYNLLTQKINFPPQDIIFDPNILTIATGMDEHNNFAVNYLMAVEWIKKNLPFVKISGGVSNLSFAFRGNDTVREAMHAVFLYHAIRYGMDMAIVNAGALPIYDDIPKDLLTLVENCILNKTQNATEKLIEFAENIKKTPNQTEKVNDWRNWAVDERIKYALIKGIADYIENDVLEAKQNYSSPIKIIEGPLMDAMNTVGEKFGAGKMFLPQVVKSARVMKKSVSVLLPYIEEEKKYSKSVSQGKILLATVKGDVHDIGKNIVNVVLACNNFEVIDLGVMVNADKIIEVAKKENVDLIGLSGLISPSLNEMIFVAEEMERNGMKIPLLIGGATTSKIHTAVKLSPAYSGTSVHVIDASKSVGVAKNLIAKNSEFYKKINNEYNELRIKYATKNTKLIDLQKARSQKIPINWSKELIAKPNFIGRKTILSYPIDEICKYIDWNFFFFAWDINGKYPHIFNHPEKGAESQKLYQDAQNMLKLIIKNGMLQANAVFAIYPANSVGDSVYLYQDENMENILTGFHFLRQQEEKDRDSKYEYFLSLADYIAPKNTGLTDYIGAFAVTTGIGIEKHVQKFKNENDDYSAIMLKILADRLAEAFAELLHYKIRTEFWQYDTTQNRKLNENTINQYNGIRPAFGYPACPDHSEKEKLFDLLDCSKQCGINLTESFMMNPAASVSGLYFANCHAKYFNLGKIGLDQINDYALRKKIPTIICEKYLSANLGY